MANNTPEQDLIDEFVVHLSNHIDPELNIAELINSNCKSKKFADVEFISGDGAHWVIEAKSHNSSDKYNTRHKLFGELLKETGKNNRSSCNYALLIPNSGLDFYRKGIRTIARDKFIGFGDLIPVHSVFTCDAAGITQFSWQEFYSEN